RRSTAFRIWYGITRSVRPWPSIRRQRERNSAWTHVLGIDAQDRPFGTVPASSSLRSRRRFPTPVSKPPAKELRMRQAWTFVSCALLGLSLASCDKGTDDIGEQFIVRLSGVNE